MSTVVESAAAGSAVSASPVVAASSASRACHSRSNSGSAAAAAAAVSAASSAFSTATASASATSTPSVATEAASASATASASASSSAASASPATTMSDADVVGAVAHGERDVSGALTNWLVIGGSGWVAGSPGRMTGVSIVVSVSAAESGTAGSVVSAAWAAARASSAETGLSSLAERWPGRAKVGSPWSG